MTVRTVVHHVDTKGQGDTRDLTPLVTSTIADSSLTAGLVTIAVIGSTAGITTLEFEPGVVGDLNALWERLAPRDGEYGHHRRWGDDNGSSHVRAALLGPSISIPFTKGRLILGTWQQVALFEFDTGPRDRQIVIQLLGE